MTVISLSPLCSLAKISLKSGVMRTHHVLVDPGNIPRGYLADCIEISNKTHNIPVDYPGLCGDYNKILEVRRRLGVIEKYLLTIFSRTFSSS